MTELDLPLLPNADQIRRRMFATVRRGFDPDQVREYLKQVADQVENLEAQVREAKLAAETGGASSAAGEARGDPYSEVASRVADLLRSADQQAETLVAEAKREADTLVGGARTEADRVRLDAQSRAEEVKARADKALSTARERAEREVSGLSGRRRSLQDDLRKVHERLLAMAADLSSTLDKVGEAVLDEEPVADPPDEPSETPAGAAGTETPAPTGAEPDLVDPRYEDLWASSDDVELELPDLPPLDDLEIEAEDRETSGGETR